ncbi:DUF58 domain-containing protein [Alloscardovia theropitheci]|uniref:DUF58 domain-containing protein n=1 Tax=Alloscardovia theropitheci TaxID=2496842 RepID=A0A4R0QYW1_9BIFI|nr:DUF58 domain-containing protein [Alloscardovia theropitheci]TCD54891.1 DUF58 domain-containing protein [Alloscardovia theropitheci]
MVAHTTSDPIRRKIEALGPRLTLPIVRKAMGIVEGEHHSNRRGSGYDFLDLRPYVIGDESRAIDWKASARAGLPIVASKEHNATSNVWMLIDTGRELTGSTPSAERQIDVAMNALRMFAMLSLKRADNVNFVVGNSHSITRMPFSGGYLECDALLDNIAHHPMPYASDWESMLDYARHIRDKYSLIIMVTSDTSWNDTSLETVGLLAQTHPIVVINVTSVNPAESFTRFDAVYDGLTGKRVPAFMRNTVVRDEINVSRHMTVHELDHQLTSKGATLFNADSSESMFNEFVHRISLAHSSSTRALSVAKVSANTASLASTANSINAGNEVAA